MWVLNSVGAVLVLDDLSFSHYLGTTSAKRSLRGACPALYARMGLLPFGHFRHQDDLHGASFSVCRVVGVAHAGLAALSRGVRSTCQGVASVSMLQVRMSPNTTSAAPLLQRRARGRSFDGFFVFSPRLWVVDRGSEPRRRICRRLNQLPAASTIAKIPARIGYGSLGHATATLMDRCERMKTLPVHLACRFRPCITGNDREHRFAGTVQTNWNRFQLGIENGCKSEAESQSKRAITI